MAEMPEFVFRPVYARRIPDPNFHKSQGMERHIFVVPVRSLPRDLPLDPNARTPNIRRRVYQEVENSLLNQECEKNTFHLKNKGITIVADSVRQQGNDHYVVKMRRGVHGIVDGGHTFKLIEKHLDNPALPPEQHVNVEIRVGLPDAWIPDVAGGLNTSVQVQDMSLDNLSGQFEWLKKLLKPESYFNYIAWEENQNAPYDARDIIALMTMFNVELFPNDRDDQPVFAYEKKSTALKLFEEKTDSYKRMSGIVKDILKFHDLVSLESRQLWNDEAGGRGAALAFMDTRKRGEHQFAFIEQTSDCRMENGALFPLLAAFRWYVVQDRSGTMRWRDGFDGLLDAWRNVGAELLRTTHNESNQLGRNPNAIGKSRNHWGNLHTRVAKFDLMQKSNKD